VTPPNPKPTPASYPLGFVGGNSQVVVYQAYLYKYSGGWRQIASSPAYTGVASDFGGVGAWWDPVARQYTNGVWQPLVVAQPAGGPQYAYEVVGELWWMTDAYHGPDHTRGVVRHYQYKPGGRSYVIVDMGYTWCLF